MKVKILIYALLALILSTIHPAEAQQPKKIPRIGILWPFLPTVGPPFAEAFQQGLHNLVAIDDDGRPSFNLLQHHRSKASAIQFFAFDVLVYRGRSLLEVPLETRRKALSDVLGPVHDPIRLSEAFETAPTELVRVAKEQSLEGIVAKRKDSLYEPGKRSGAWLKYRINQGQEFVIGGYTPDHPFDALIVGHYEGTKLYYVGKVRNGFVPLVRREVYRKFKGLEIDTCPFANLPEKKRTMWALTRDEMKNCMA